MFGIHKHRPPRRLLVMRFSAMGDVAMTVPVLHALAVRYPDLQVTALTRTRFVPIFGWLPPNVRVVGVDFDRQDGIMGLSKLYAKLKDDHYDAVADLHDVLRSKWLRGCFAMGGTRVAVVDKGRKEKRRLVAYGAAGQAPLRPMFERYADVFRQLGLDLNLDEAPAHLDLSGEVLPTTPVRTEGERWVGVAPFAAHSQKIYPLERMERVVELLAGAGARVFLFGAGRAEGETLSQWSARFGADRVVVAGGRMGGLRNELVLMSRLNLMISMDSANMHLAAMVGTPVLAVWGATHPAAGFSCWRQTPDRQMQLGTPCRPCSIYGKKPCRHGDMRCMDFAPETIAAKALQLIEGI